MMKDVQTWINEIEFEITRLKLQGRHSYFQISVDMTKEIATEIENYFKTLYTTEFKKCNRCVNKYDVIIEF